MLFLSGTFKVYLGLVQGLLRVYLNLVIGVVWGWFDYSDLVWEFQVWLSSFVVVLRGFGSKFKVG